MNGPLQPQAVRSSSDILARHRVRVSGSGSTAIVFAHGYGCDQNVWRFVAPAFEHRHTVVVFDYFGTSASDAAMYDRERYGTLDGHADDLLAVCAAIQETRDVERIVLVGHSVSAMVGVLAARRDPTRFAQLVLMAPSPSYIDDGDYVGGFGRADIDELIEALDSNYFVWARMMAPVIMSNIDKPELADELESSFCSTDPEVAKHFARVTFLSDNRADLRHVDVPSLILQCSNDALAPLAVGRYVQRELRNSRLEVLTANGHCPHMSEPEQTLAALRRFIQ